MDVLYYPPPLASGNITHLCNSRYLVIKNLKKNPLIIVSWHTKWDKQQEISSNLTLYFLVGVASEARIDKIAKNIEFLILKYFNLQLLMGFFLSFWLIILLLRYNITNIRCDCGQYTRKFPLGTLNCIIHSMDVLYYRPPLASGNITHLCNSRYLGKIFLYIDHNHMEYLYNIMTSRSAATLVWVWKHAVIYSLSMKTIPVPISEVRKHWLHLYKSM
jgi:hypothetical protein